MTESAITLSTKKHIRTKLGFSLLSLILANIAMLLWPEDISLTIVLCIIVSAFVIYSTKFFRYWKAHNSYDVEIITLKSSVGNVNNQTTLPFKISGAIILVLVCVYMLSAIVGMEVHKILLGLGVVAMISSGFQNVVMFDYQNLFFYGLWKPKSFYDSDCQSMRETQLEFHETETGEVEKIKITDKTGHYFIQKKDYTQPVWERIIFNLERIIRLTIPDNG